MRIITCSRFTTCTAGPVARIVSVRTPGERQLTLEQEAALERTRRRLTKGWNLGGGKFVRDEIYDD